MREIAGHLDDEAETAQALHSLDCWRRALDGYRAAKIRKASA
jgi:hypothetical protein